MNSHGSLDRETFQKFLASAFAVQECQMDTQSLTAIVEIQRLIPSGDLDLDQAMHLIAERTQSVANAAGVAIGLLEGNHLTYRAGSGSAATYTGRHVMAAISVSARNKVSREILRVENAEGDARIEGAICRQFGAKALLMLLIHHGQAVAGVMEILFDEVHTFQDHEVRAYQLMAGLAGEAISHAAHLDQKRALSAEPSVLPLAIEQPSSLTQTSSSDGSVAGWACKDSVLFGGDDALAMPLPAFSRAVRAVARIGQQVKNTPHELRWNAAVSAVVIVLVIGGWALYKNHGFASPKAAALQESNPARQQVAVGLQDTPQANSTSELQRTGVGTIPLRSKSGFRLVRVGEDEVDYVAHDVTIRYFGQKISFPGARRGYRQLNIGDDVTVRYFAPKMQPVASAAQPGEHSLPEPEKAIPAKLTQSN